MTTDTLPLPDPADEPRDLRDLAKVLLRRQKELIAAERLARRRQDLAGSAVVGLMSGVDWNSLRPADLRQAARLAVDLADEVAAILDETAVPRRQKGGAS